MIRQITPPAAMITKNMKSAIVTKATPIGVMSLSKPRSMVSYRSVLVYFTAPATIVSAMRSRKGQYSASTGAITITRAANSAPQSLW